MERVYHFYSYTYQDESSRFLVHFYQDTSVPTATATSPPSTATFFTTPTLAITPTSILTKEILPTTKPTLIEVTTTANPTQIETPVKQQANEQTDTSDQSTTSNEKSYFLMAIIMLLSFVGMILVLIGITEKKINFSHFYLKWKKRLSENN